jgi:hypothetical protein
LARELVRYAESKAIFTFVVRWEGHSAATKSDDNNSLLLRLLSWETAMATSCDNHEDTSATKSNRLLFRKVAKIVFEETADPTVARAGHATNRHDDGGGGATQWFWGGVDLCCPPPNNKIKINSNEDATNETVSTARLQLPRDEYEKVRTDLVSGQSFFEQETANATIRLKMGGLWEGLGLTAVALD